MPYLVFFDEEVILPQFSIRDDFETFLLYLFLHEVVIFFAIKVLG